MQKRIIDTETLDILLSFGLDVVLSDEDDAQLWAAVLKKYWPRVTDPKIDKYTLYFDVAVYDQEQKMSLRSLESWGFERVGTGHLMAKKWNKTDLDIEADARIDIAPRGLQTQLPYLHLAIARPSRNQTEVFVYNAIHAAPRLGHGSTSLWVYRKPRIWWDRKLGTWKEKWSSGGRGWIS